MGRMGRMYNNNKKKSLYLVRIGCSVPFISFTCSLGSVHFIHSSSASLVHSISFPVRFTHGSVHFIHFTHRFARSLHSPVRSTPGSLGSVHFIHFTDTNSNSPSYHHSPVSPAYPRLHLSPQTGTTPSATCPSQTAGCPA